MNQHISSIHQGDEVDRWVDPFNYTWVEPKKIIIGSIPYKPTHIDQLHDEGIRSILSMTETDINNYDGIQSKVVEHDMEWFHCPTVDNGITPDEIAIEAVKFIAAAPKPIYIHCRGGISRSGAITCAYYAYHENYSLEEALQKVSVRWNIQRVAHSAQQSSERQEWLRRLFVKPKRGEPMNLNEGLLAIANDFDLDKDELLLYASEDDIGGYHTDETLAKWLMGSMWEVEGIVLYALIRLLKPKLVVELGSYFGCSTAHILTALNMNGEGKLIAIDDGRGNAKREPLVNDLEDLVEIVTGDAIDYVKNIMPIRKVDFILEDLDHTVPITRQVWETSMKKVKKQGMIMSHDARHYVVGEAVQTGIAQAGAEVETYLINPSDCGFALWRKS